MLSVHLDSGRVALRQDPPLERPEGFALIRLLCGGICNTDLELQRGYYGFSGVPGHEFVGEVVESDSKDLLGKRVVGEINLACGHCAWCKRGKGRHCPSRAVLGIVKHPGAFAEFLTLPENNLHVLPDSIPTEVAVFTEPLAAACEILDQVQIPCGTPVAVLGDGKLGLLVAQVLQANGYRVHQFGRHPEKLQIAAKAGVTTEVRGDHLPEAEYRWVVDATGSQAGLHAAIRMVEPAGTIILKSTVHGAIPLDTAPVIVNEITLVGSRCGRFEPALELLRLGAVDVNSMISEQMKLEAAPAAFEKAAQRGVMKVLLSN
ncbi:MAG TPA: alcohol dehydrogenase catalytic domain-containing protein [Bryobacteraceae bacterium]|nr:alcohol dehydrogenase catalytic domain-containing protein [Bryobacteraceae bacterium]